MPGYQPNPYPLSPQAQALNDYADRMRSSGMQAIESAKAAAAGGIRSASDSVMGAMAPNERQLAAQAAWAERLKAARATPGVLEQLVAQLRGLQMPASIPQGSLAEIVNGMRD